MSAYPQHYVHDGFVLFLEGLRLRAQSISAPMLIVLGMSLVALILRMPLMWAYLGFTSDMGSYLMTRNWVLLDDPTAHMIAHYRPPIVGALLVPFTWVLGDLAGSKLLALIASVSIAPAFFILARKLMDARIAAVAALIVLFYPNYSEMAAGGYLSLLAFSVMFIALRALTGITEKPTRNLILAHVAATFVLVGLNQTVAGWYAVIGGIMALTAFYSHGFRTGGVLAATVGASFFVSLVWLPFYGLHSPLENGNLLMLEGSFLSVFVRLDSLVLLTLFSFALAISGRRVAMFAVPGILLALGMNFTSADILVRNQIYRAVAIVPLFAVLAGGIVLNDKLRIIPRIISPQNTNMKIGLFLAAAFVGQLVWSNSFTQVADPLDMVTGDNIAVMEWIESETPEDAAFYVHPNGLGWWLGGMAKRKWTGSWYERAPVIFQPEQDAFNCTLGWTKDCNPTELRELGYQYILIDSSRPIAIYNLYNVESTQDSNWPALWAIADSQPHLKELYRRGDAIVYEVLSQ